MAFFFGLVAITALFYGISWVTQLDYLRPVQHDMLLAAAFMFTMIGVSHLRKPDLMLYMVPEGLPAPRLLVYLSGVAEIVLSVGLLVPATRTVSAWGLIVLLIAIFPANINVAVNNLPPPGGLPAKPWYIWSRLLFQPLYIGWIWYAAIAP
ncbi:DoxX family membrane protein [Fibrella sp. WM1]|uniref:DoxX family protein n=1 Tax=Fibrella musci TaxID=3242485 RepID=UPI00352292F5